MQSTKLTPLITAPGKCPNPRSGRLPYVVAAIARFAGSIVIGGSDPGACAPGFMLTRAPRATPSLSRLVGTLTLTSPKGRGEEPLSVLMTSCAADPNGS